MSGQAGMIRKLLVLIEIDLTAQTVNMFSPPQSQMDDKDRTIRIQQNKLEQYEKEKSKSADLSPVQDAKNIETATSATQTDRVSSANVSSCRVTKLT
jgi:hypothetical protein